MAPGGSRQRGTVVALCVVLFAFASGCGNAAAEKSYSDDTKNGFMAACSDAVTDSRLVSNVCGCTFDAVKDQLEYSELETLDKTLQADPEVELPPEVYEAIGACVAQNSARK